MSAPARVAPWEDFVLRVIAIWKLSHAAFFIAVGFGLLRLKHRHSNVYDLLQTYVVIPYHLDPENKWVDWTLDKASLLSPHLAFFGWTAFFYAALFAVEGIGLYLRKHWAEYMVVIVTGSLLPVEISTLFHAMAWWKVGLVIGNLLIVGYLIHRIVLDARNRSRLRQEEELKIGKSGVTSAAPSTPVVNQVP